MLQLVNGETLGEMNFIGNTIGLDSSNILLIFAQVHLCTRSESFQVYIRFSYVCELIEIARLLY